MLIRQPNSSLKHPNAWRRLSTGAAFVALCAGVLLPTEGSASASSAVPSYGYSRAPTARPSKRPARTRVIVRLRGPLGATQRRALAAAGATIYRHLPIVRSVAISLPHPRLSRLKRLAFVEHVSPDLGVRKCDEFTVASSGAGYAYNELGLTGRGITVAVLDSGVTPNSQDLADRDESRVLQAVNFVGGTTSPNDLCGHGTHVAGIVAGNGAASSRDTCFRTFYGIARRANILNVRVLDGNGAGNVSTVIAGIQWVVNNRSRYNIRVLNLSLGHPVTESYSTDPLCQAVEQAWNAGIVVVCAAGNMGRQFDSLHAGADNEGWGTAYGSIQSPANDPYVITVGAMKSIGGDRSNDRIATYSSRGPSRVDLCLKPDIVAPGNQVISLNANRSYLYTAYGGTNQIPRQLYSTTKADASSAQYFRLSGTSMAAPVVSGAAALLLEANPSLTPDTVKARLMFSADKWVSASSVADACTYGAGYLNIPAALDCRVVATKPAMSPSLYIVDGKSVAIDLSRATWGAHAIWGTGVMDPRLIWGSQALWGVSFNLLTASHALWGSSVWSDHAI